MAEDKEDAMPVDDEAGNQVEGENAEEGQEEEEEEEEQEKPKSKDDFVLPKGVIKKNQVDPRFYLDIARKNEKGKMESLGKQALGHHRAYVFGRSDTATVTVAHPSLSRQHAAVVHLKSGPAVMDLGSTAGTCVNGKKIKAKVPIPLKKGYYFTLGKSTRRYYIKFNPDGKGPEDPRYSHAAVKPKEVPPAEQPAALTKKRPNESVTVKKLSEAEIAKLKAKKARLSAANNVGARKAIATAFKTMPIPRSAPQSAVTLEEMASTGTPSAAENPFKKSPKLAPMVHKDFEGDDPDSLQEGGVSWLVKPEVASKKAEDSD